MKKIYFIRQTIVVGGMALCSISDGFIFGQMSGMVDSLRKENSTIKLDEDDISWIGDLIYMLLLNVSLLIISNLEVDNFTYKRLIVLASTINITCFCGFVMMGALTEILGRRKSITIVSIPIAICWLLVYFAHNKATLLATRVIVGLSYGGILVLTYINIGEYVSPNMRSFCMNMMSCVGATSGTMLGHILSLFLHWRNVALIGLVPTIISAFIPLFWIESPFWLATRNRFDECEQAFKKLHEYDEAAEKELKTLIEIQKRNHGINKKKCISQNFLILIKKYIEACKHRYYWKTVFLMFVICTYRVAAGRILLSTLAITIIQDVTGTTDILGYTLLVDGFALLGSTLSCILVRLFNMRTLLFTSGVISNIFQSIFAISLYQWPGNSHSASWLKIILLALYYITVTAGPYSVLETLLTELHPLEIKTVNCLLLGAIFSVVQFLSIQFAMRMFASIGYHGVFLLNSTVVFLCLFYLYFYLPETKGRTLQEIEYFFKNNSFPLELPCSASEKEKLHKIGDIEPE